MAAYNVRLRILAVDAKNASEVQIIMTEAFSALENEEQPYKYLLNEIKDEESDKYEIQFLWRNDFSSKTSALRWAKATENVIAAKLGDRVEMRGIEIK